MDELLGCIRVQSGQMRRNLDLSGDFMASENVMMTLAPEIGRTRAHDLVHHAVADAKKRSTSLAKALLTDGVLPEAISASNIHEALDPTRYTGLSKELARQMAATAREAAQALNARAAALDQ